jgi:transglutaminase-like putative cysteine protease
MKNKLMYLVFAVLFLVNGCNQSSENAGISPEKINKEIEKGNFSRAEKMIYQYMKLSELSDEQKYEWNYQMDLMERIKRDFSQTEEELTGYLKEYYPDLTDAMMREWEEKNYIEMRMIDGERMYFNSAGRNFFRINRDENKVRIARDGNQSNALTDFCEMNAPEVIQDVKKSGKNYVQQKNIKMNYKLVVDANVVPENEIIRCWLPYPRINEQRLPEIEFITANGDYIMADKNQLQRTIYMEKPAVKDKETVFEYSFRVKTAAQWFDINPDDIKEYNMESELYKTNTAERPPHIVFSENLKNLTDSIVGDEQNPFKIVRKIYTWIDMNIPWASALEYGIMENIPAYVLENQHGDCGMQTLLFMTMARYKGIPAKWQSGWMLHPGDVNLHDWAEVYYEGIGWVPVDQSFSMINSEDDEVRYFYANGIDAYRLIVNDDYARDLYPAKIYPRSEPNDFQRGEVEWKGGNLYFDKWDYWMKVEYLDVD